MLLVDLLEFEKFVLVKDRRQSRLTHGMAIAFNWHGVITGDSDTRVEGMAFDIDDSMFFAFFN